MAFGDFDLKTAIQTFGLAEDLHTDLFLGVKPLEISEFLQAWLREFTRVAIGMNTEKARSEFIILPILVEAKRRAEVEINIHPGISFDVDKSKGLSGFCDYLIARSQEIYYLRSPLIAVVEAKKEDIVNGLGQCAAEMVAIQIFNERDGKPLPAVFGCVTSGSIWQFLKLEKDTLFIDRTEYYLGEVGKIVGILVSIGNGSI